jgi:polyisoprenyl-phosphate glycosyltransferase
MSSPSAATRCRPIRRVQVVIPVLNEAENIGPLIRELSDALSNWAFSLLIIDDGSTDGTLKELQALRGAGLPVDYVSLSRNFGKEAALMAGFMECPDNFDALVTMDGDGQHPPLAVAEMIMAAERAAADLVIGVRANYNYQSAVSRQMRRAFYTVFNALSETKLPYGIGDFNLYRPVAVEAVRSFQEYDLFLRGLVAWIGFNPVFVEHEVKVQAGRTSRWTFRRLLKLTADGLMSFTDWPLRVWSLVGAALATMSFLYLAATLIQTLLFGNPVQGYPTVIITILGLGGLQLLSIGVLGGYIGRTYVEAKQRPRYVIRESSFRTSSASRASTV